MLFEEIVKKYKFKDIELFIENDKKDAKKLLKLLKDIERDTEYNPMIMLVEPSIGLLALSDVGTLFHVSVLPLDISLNCYVNKKDLEFYGEKELLAMFIDDCIKNNEKIKATIDKVKQLEVVLHEHASYQEDYNQTYEFEDDGYFEINFDEEHPTDLMEAQEDMFDDVIGLNYRAIEYLKAFAKHKKNYVEVTFRIYEDKKYEIVNFINVNKKIKYKNPYKEIDINNGEKLVLYEYIFDDGSYIYEDIQTTRCYGSVLYFMALKDSNDNWITETLWKNEEIEEYK